MTKESLKMAELVLGLHYKTFISIEVSRVIKLSSNIREFQNAMDVTNKNWYLHTDMEMIRMAHESTRRLRMVVGRPL